MIVDDPSGNSFIENPFAPALDPARVERHYVRNTEQVDLDSEIQVRFLI